MVVRGGVLRHSRPPQIAGASPGAWGFPGGGQGRVRRIAAVEGRMREKPRCEASHPERVVWALTGRSCAPGDSLVEDVSPSAVRSCRAGMAGTGR